MPKVKDIKTEWDLSCLMNEDDLKNKDKELNKYTRDNKYFVNKWKSRNDYLESPGILKEALDEYEMLIRKYLGGGVSGYYFILKSFIDQNNSSIKAELNKIQDVVIRNTNEIEFFINRLSKITKDRQKIFLNAEILKPYKHYLEILFKNSSYLLSESEEKILNIFSPISYDNWIKMTSDILSREKRTVLDEKGNKVFKVYSEIWSNTIDKNKKVRDSSASALNDILSKNSDIAENEINSILQYKKSQDELRGMKYPDLQRHLSDDIDSEVVSSLIKAVQSKYDISRKYYELKSRLMGVKKLKYHERNVEYGNINHKYSFEEASEYVGRALKKMDDEFYKIYEEMLSKGRIDVYPKEGKESSEFCASLLLEKPAFILLNYSGYVSDITTLGHEMGHALNDALVRKNQNALNISVPLSTAEVASIFMQSFVLDEIFTDSSDEEKIILNMMVLNDAVSSIMRQVSCYNFELELHNEYRKKGYLPKEEIGNIFQKHMNDYMGDYVEQSKGSENWWIAWDHIRSFFYVYSYAGGYLLSEYMRKRYLEDHRFIHKVKTFLSAGSSVSPGSLFLDLGMDISKESFWNYSLKQIENLLQDTWKLAERMKRI